MDKDVTNLTKFGLNDDEYLPLLQCVCGAGFDPWDFILSIYEDTSKQCPICHRKLYFKSTIRIYEVNTDSIC